MENVLSFKLKIYFTQLGAFLLSVYLVLSSKKMRFDKIVIYSTKDVMILDMKLANYSTQDVSQLGQFSENGR